MIKKKNFILLLIILLSSCIAKKKEPSLSHDFDAIQKRDTLTVITLSSSTSYFIYKDEQMGYDYDLCKDFCDHYGLVLEIKVAENSTCLQKMLEEGDGDLIAYGIPMQRQQKDSLIYCGLKQVSHQVLVQRASPKDTLIKDVTQLIGKEICIKGNTKYHQRLLNLNAEIGGGIKIKEIDRDTITTEDLIEMVSKHKIKYTVSDEDVARLNKTYYHNINISMPISLEQQSSWAVRKNSPLLAKALDKWFSEKSNMPIYRGLTKKYFELSKLPVLENDDTKSIKTPKGHLSPYDNLFKKYAEPLGYDWRLLVSIAYQESKFHTGLSSWAGATGLMGLMPRTARSLGISSDDRTNPELSIKAGVALLVRLDKIFSKIEDKDERIKFVLASYNGGNGHINDAQALARKYGANPYLWDGNVRKYVALKSSPEYYNDPVCKNGYFRGGETLSYVDQVEARWHKYQSQKLTESN